MSDINIDFLRIIQTKYDEIDTEIKSLRNQPHLTVEQKLILNYYMEQQDQRLKQMSILFQQHHLYNGGKEIK